MRDGSSPSAGWMSAPRVIDLESDGRAPPVSRGSRGSGTPTIGSSNNLMYLSPLYRREGSSRALRAHTRRMGVQKKLAKEEDGPERGTGKCTSRGRINCERACRKADDNKSGRRCASRAAYIPTSFFLFIGSLRYAHRREPFMSGLFSFSHFSLDSAAPPPPPSPSPFCRAAHAPGAAYSCACALFVALALMYHFVSFRFPFGALLLDEFFSPISGLMPSPQPARSFAFSFDAAAF